MKFDKMETAYSKVVNFAIDMFENQHGSSDNVKLMLILSDGKGIFEEGEKVVKSAVARAKAQNIFVLFIPVENPTCKVTINFPFTILFMYDNN